MLKNMGVDNKMQYVLLETIRVARERLSGVLEGSLVLGDSMRRLLSEDDGLISSV